MFRHIAAFELRYQLRSPVFWVGCLIFFLLTFGATTVDQIRIGGRGSEFVNAPYQVVTVLGIMSVFAVFIIVALVANVVIRDDETGFAPILRATRLTRRDYLGGRFAGASVAALLVLAMMPLGILTGSLMPWLDPETVGPFRPGDYLYALFAIGLPTALIVGASFFALATATRSLIWTYVGATAFIVLFFLMRGLLRDPQYDTISALADPFGLAALGIATKYWTATDRNTLLPQMTGLLLANRLLWTGVAAALFAVAYAVFRMEGGRGRPQETGATAAEPQPAAGESGAHRQPPQQARPADAGGGALGTPAGPATGAGRAQLARLARFDMAFVFRSPAFFVLLGIGMLNSMAQLWFAGRFYGNDAYPATRLMVNALEGAFSLFPIIIAIYYAGELVWRDRERRVHEIVDASAAPDWAHLVPKIAAISGVLLATSLAAVAGGMAVQLMKGYTRLELAHYLTWFVAPQTVTAVLLAVLSVFVQVLVPHKFIGWGVMLVYLVATIALGTAGFEHNLYNYAGTPNVPLSDMNGTARFWIGRAWFGAYWVAFACVLMVIAYALWPRGAAGPLRARFGAAPRRLRGAAGGLLALFVVATAALGGWAFYNTNVLNRYTTAPQRDELLADAEKTLLPYETVPQPRITRVNLDVQLFPRDTRAVTRGSYLLENRSGKPLDTLHVRWGERLRIDALDVPGAKPEREFKAFNYRIYRLDPPMAPGERRTLDFATTLEERGFPNSNPLTRIVENGTFINNDEIAPRLGMSRDGLLRDRGKRRKHGLPPELRPAKLEDDWARANSALRNDSDWVDAEITVTTDADQTPIAPGYTVSDATANGRRTVKFRTDAPINHFFSIQSARYAVQKDRWKDVDLAVYYHPGHEYNVQRMIDAMKVSLELFSAKFSPYQFRQARILEFPSYASFAQSFANTIPYSEDIGFLARHTDPEKIDVVTYVTAHEIAHQWWAHQVIPSEQQGATMLVESFAQYGALLVMEKMYGRDQIRRFLKYELDRYLRSRGGAVIEELPLARVEDQQYIHYQKGSLAMYWLREVVGEDAVNRALAKLIAAHGFRAAPYPNTTDFLKLLRAEAGPQHDALVADLFERITLFDARVADARAVKRADGRWDVTFDVEAKKLYADGRGRETEAPLDEEFEIGVFSAEPGKKDFDAKSVLLFERRRVTTGRQAVTVTVDREPRFVGVDPYNKRIDRNSDDNVTRVGVK
jgi:aminopeptidase N